MVVAAKGRHSHRPRLGHPGNVHPAVLFPADALKLPG